jgi:hypothetical protein
LIASAMWGDLMPGAAARSAVVSCPFTSSHESPISRMSTRPETRPETEWRAVLAENAPDCG